jgi:hypothetical protein
MTTLDRVCKIKRFIKNWQTMIGTNLPVSCETTSKGDFIYQMDGFYIGFAFGMSGRPVSCYWLKGLEEWFQTPDASNEYVTREKLDILIAEGRV